MTALVLLDHDGSVISQSSRTAVTMAAKLGDVHALVAGCGPDTAGAAARIDGVTKVLHASADIYAHALAEPLTALIVSLAAPYSHIVAVASATGKNIMPRVAALLDVQPISDVVVVEDEQTFVRPIYAGNALAKVRSSDAKRVLTVRAAAFEAASAQGGAAEITKVGSVADPALSRFVCAELSQSERPDLVAARVVVSGGRGMGSSENFALLEAVADRLGGAVGASRAAVDSGFAPNDHQVGQTGKIVAPELYIAVGISGAIQHLAGMKDSKIIVAINKDADAPIFQVADYGYVADLFEVLPELNRQLGSA